MPATRDPFIATPAGRQLLRQTLENINLLLGSIPHDGTAIDDYSVGSTAPEPIDRADHRSDGGDVINAGHVRNVKHPRVLKARTMYTATRPTHRNNITGMTPAQIEVMNLLVSTKRPLSVPEIMENLNLARKTVENATSALNVRKLLETHQPRR
jgi:DNA-binding NarL/FixJ family response regulator